MTPETTGPFDAAIAELESRIRAMQITLETLKQLRAQSDGAGPSSASVPRSVEAEVQHDSFFGMTIADAAKKYLSMVKRTQSTGEIAVALESGGLKHASKDFQQTLRATLGQKGELFLRVNGDWGLNEWYPGKGRGKKTEKPRRTVKKKKRKSVRGTEPQSSPQALVEKYVADHPSAESREIADALQMRIQTVSLLLGKLTANKVA